MSNRRAPLSSIPNAANSPYRTVAAAASKRSRGEAGLQEDLLYEGSHPIKRQALESKSSNFRTPPQKQPLLSVGDGLFGKRTQNQRPTAFERKLLAAKDGQQSQKAERLAGEALEGIRAWQKHYRRVFPMFVFYFESVPDDILSRCARQIRSLGAREEKFFSKEVTHVVTTRAIPSDSDTSPTELETSSSKKSSQPNGQPRTINPTLLNKPTTLASNEQRQPSSNFPFESFSRKARPLTRNSTDGESKRLTVGNGDILQRAHGMGMKIWQVEKLQRVISTMTEDPTQTQTQQGRNARGISAGGKAAEEDLSHMLRNEQRNKPSDSTSAEGIIPFRGYFLYVRDMNEKTKPILVKEFTKPSRNESGDWPQFHANNPGKCPFVEDYSIGRQDFERIREQQQVENPKKRAGKRAPPRTRAETAMESKRPGPVPEATERQPLIESKNGSNRSVPAREKLPVLEFQAPPVSVSANHKSPRKGPLEISATAAPKLFGGEPAASGLQPSNITSAIRSQMISSTAAAPGARAGTSKEVHGLKRKVLEKNSAPGLHGIKGPYIPTAAVGPARAEHAIPVTRQSRRRAQEQLVHIEEESTQSGDDEDIWRAEEVIQPEKVVQSQCVKAKPKDPKPGYCENCREKYNDFDQHIVGRKHRRFALTKENWVDLDRLLAQLGRPLKEEEEVDDPDDF